MFRYYRKFGACVVLLGAMSSVTSMRRPSAADVKPGSELYERIVQALRGEYQWRRTSYPSRAEKRFSVLNESQCHPRTVANVTEETFPMQFNTNRSENLPSVETPIINRPHHVHNGVGQTCTAIVENEQALETTNEPSALRSASTNSTMMSIEWSIGQDVTVTSPTVRPATSAALGNHDAQAAHCSVAQKLQKISQVDKTCSSTKPKPQSKYKPPYKIERSHKPSIV